MRYSYPLHRSVTIFLSIVCLFVSACTLDAGMPTSATIQDTGDVPSVTATPSSTNIALLPTTTRESPTRERGTDVSPTPTMIPPTATSIPPTATPVPPTQPPPPPPGNVIISFIYYDGQVYRVESDEFAEIANVGGSPVDIGGWRLNAGDPGQDFIFPGGFILQPGQSCRVYTNETHPETCGFSFGRGSAIWNNKGDCGALYDSEGQIVSERCY